MATSTFTLEIVDIIEEAFERASGGAHQLQTAHDYKTAHRSLNLLTMEWANRGINLWTVEQGLMPLVAGVYQYALPADTIDLLNYSIRTGVGVNQVDINLQRISVMTYANIPNKLSTGRPLQVYLQRTEPPVMTVWPVPDRDGYTLIGWRMRRIQDAGAAGNAVMDIPFRFVPALIAGLAFYIAQKIPEGAERAVLLQQAYEADFDTAMLEDREKATYRIVPKIARV